MESKQLFDKYNEGRHWEKHPIIYAERFVNFLKKQNFRGLLVDIGCGNGRDVNFFQQHGLKAIGIDYSDKEIKISKDNYPECEFEVQNAEELKFKDKSVDAFYMINVIHYLRKDKALQEAYRALKNNGYFFIHFNISIIDKEGHVDYRHQESDILNLVSDFQIVEKRIFERHDTIPKDHTHKIMELILKK